MEDLTKKFYQTMFGSHSLTSLSASDSSLDIVLESSQRANKSLDGQALKNNL